jgi:hypothetical protein
MRNGPTEFFGVYHHCSIIFVFCFVFLGGRWVGYLYPTVCHGVLGGCQRRRLLFYLVVRVGCLFVCWVEWVDGMGWVDRSIDTLGFVVPLRLTLGEGLSFVCLFGVCVLERKGCRGRFLVLG